MPGHGGKPRTLARTISRTSYDWSLSWVFAPFLLIVAGYDASDEEGGERRDGWRLGRRDWWRELVVDCKG